MTTAAPLSESLYAPEIRGQSFDAGVTASELMEVNEPGPKWPARSVRISRSHIVISSKRMCHIERKLLLAVHKIDAHPLILEGSVESCSYVAGGLCCVVVRLKGIAESEVAETWSSSFAPKGARS